MWLMWFGVFWVFPITINSSFPGQNGSHFADMLKRILLNGKFGISIQILLVHVMAWRRKDDTLLPESMLNQFTDIYAAIGRYELRHF